MFVYDTAITERFPTIRAGLIHATGLANGPSPAELLTMIQAGQQSAAALLESTPLAELPSIAAWRRAFTLFGTKPTQHRNAAESLLRRLSKQGEIPSINTLVDIGNLVSIRHALPVAMFDLAHISGRMTVRFASGDEPFADLGSSEGLQPDPGEVIFVDEAGVVCARRWCWRQSAGSATRDSTMEALIVVEGLHDNAEADVAAAIADLESLLAAHQTGNQTRSWTLSPAQGRSGNPNLDDSDPP